MQGKDRWFKLISFVNGFGKERGDAEIVNAFYLASRLTRRQVSFKFLCQGCIGVSCGEIALMLDYLKANMNLFNVDEPDEKLYYAGQLLSKIQKTELGLMASYMQTKRSHLYLEEAAIARAKLQTLKAVVLQQIPIETAILLF